MVLDFCYLNRSQFGLRLWLRICETQIHKQLHYILYISSSFVAFHCHFASSVVAPTSKLIEPFLRTESDYLICIAATSF